MEFPLSGSDNVNMKKSCRVCLSQFDLGIPLFEPNETLNNTTAASLIWKCFHIKMQENDKLPSQICNECALNILISHNFKIQLHQSHKLLQSQISNDHEHNNGFEEGFRVIKIDNNLYRIKSNSNVNDMEDEAAQFTKNYDSILRTLKIDEELKLKQEDIFLVITDEPNSGSASESRKPEEERDVTDAPRNLKEACEWLKLIKQAGPPYECRVCNRKYHSKYLTFYTHVRLHFAKKIQCPLCPIKYLPYRKEFHMRTHTKEKPYVCAHCGKSFSMKNHLNQHLKLRCNIEKDSPCRICQKVFTTYKLLHTHLVKEHGTCRHEENRSECAVCSRDNKNKNMCEYCGTKVTRYNRHLNTCKAAPITMKFQLQNATTCDKCGELFFSKFQLECHMKRHENQNTCTCMVCGQVFLRKQYLKDHMEIHEPGQYPCEKCGKIFRRRLLLKKHRSTHQAIKKYVCGICSKRCRTKDQLSKHLVVHTKEKPYVCALCNKAFSLKGNLNQHLAIHNKVKSFLCTVCNKTFTLKGNLTKHMLIHDNLRG